ncbi:MULTISPECIES: hypothetical protein [Methylorubrum]|uniref:hypothetical protein n=1 Tax=Methylorubrum TaxID=2282523 RepID=UPI0020A0610F|nr:MULTISPECIES: hypothetical protein [Methylorubrum]MCP1547335.1 hypothetical protein [Methylorubrum zatmanii]MCP1556049.1 hypothetical protein [Methylorubrum extorquens]MCP1577638.1 hypothetical protein [Methylorubrum extorquens]
MPSPRRDRTGGAPRVLRGLTAVAALYALVLQALLGGIAALPVAGAPAVLCQPIADGTVSAEAAKDGLPAPDSRYAGCCTAAHHAPAATLPPPVSAEAARPERDAARAGWSGVQRRAARPPPFTLAHARAPPAA